MSIMSPDPTPAPALGSPDPSPAGCGAGSRISIIGCPSKRVFDHSAARVYAGGYYSQFELSFAPPERALAREDIAQEALIQEG
jgi:hypothetical protein